MFWGCRMLTRQLSQTLWGPFYPRSWEALLLFFSMAKHSLPYLEPNQKTRRKFIYLFRKFVPRLSHSVSSSLSLLEARLFFLVCLGLQKQTLPTHVYYYIAPLASRRHIPLRSLHIIVIVAKKTRGCPSILDLQCLNCSSGYPTFHMKFLCSVLTAVQPGTSWYLS